MAKMLSPGFPLRRSAGRARYLLLALIIIFVLYTFNPSSGDIRRYSPLKDQLSPETANSGQDLPVTDNESPDSSNPPAKAKQPGSKDKESEEPQEPLHKSPPEGWTEAHPIDKLVYDAQINFKEVVSRETKTIEDAAQAYRRRRGRHPPPGFDLWFNFAQENNAVIIEDFFDQIYHDLHPFWGLSPKTLRKESWDWEMTINVRNGNASAKSDFFWTQIWLDMIKSIEHMLPDMDLALNVMDEPRLVVPWQDVADYVGKADKTFKLAPAQEVVREFQKLPKKPDRWTWTRRKRFESTKPYWKIVRRGCAPDSPAQQIGLLEWYDKTPTINSTYADEHMYEGYVSNFTHSTDVCHQPDLQTLEGIFIQPLSTSATKVMTPFFGGSKLSTNNEILLPAPMYWKAEERFTGGDDHGGPWDYKYDAAVWRGVATGGRNTEHNWRGFQRHRFVAMNNGTKLTVVERGQEAPENFALPEARYKLKAQRDRRVGEWLDEWSDVSFTDLSCTPPQDDRCNYTDHYFYPTPQMKMAQQFEHKYVPDIDGNSFSGRYLGFLRSTSLPLKATIWREWHDSRLFAWKHFVPMDSRFGDYYGIMEYFLGYGGKGSHDAVAANIARDGKEWADKVLRKEDMQIYTLRLLLEFARILDDKRENLGWVDDVLADPSIEQTWRQW